MGCGNEVHTPIKRVITRAYVGEKRIDIRKDLAFRADIVETAVFGEPLDILQWKRRYALVRTVSGKEGWLDGRVLVRAQEMDALKQIARDFKDTIPMGQAKVYEVLNIHTSPNRSSPSFEKLPPEELVDVLGHRVALRAPYQGPVQPAKVTKKRKKKAEADDEPKVPPPPSPKAPALPADWKDLSRNAAAEPEVKTGGRSSVKNAMLLTKTRPIEVGPRYDDWTLVRTRNGSIGWVISSALTMALPDDVAQYANRNRITSYFAIGEVVDSEKGRKHHFLWTTMSKRAQPYQFDSFRVLLFNTKRHRYETGHWEKELTGYLPIRVMDPAQGAPTFNLILEDGDGTFWRRRYIFENNRVKFIDQARVERPRLPTAPEDLPPLEMPDTLEPEEVSLWGRLRRKVLGQ
jgi:SH3-like domain-containing protein